MKICYNIFNFRNTDSCIFYTNTNFSHFYLQIIVRLLTLKYTIRFSISNCIQMFHFRIMMFIYQSYYCNSNLELNLYTWPCVLKSRPRYASLYDVNQTTSKTEILHQIWFMDPRFSIYFLQRRHRQSMDFHFRIFLLNMSKRKTV